MKKQKDKGLVYSTEFGRMCPRCHKQVEKCRCKSQQIVPENDGIVRLRRETKGRKGKAVTVITGIPLAGQELKKLVKSLKKKCGSGGTLKNGIVEIQGDHRDLLERMLTDLGYKVKA
jgi:translation initiation factor 1